MSSPAAVSVPDTMPELGTTRATAVLLTAREIGHLYRRAYDKHVNSVRCLIRCGGALDDIKASVKHGEWLTWLKRHRKSLGFTERTARKLIAGFNRFRTLESDLDSVQALTISRSIWGHGVTEQRQVALRVQNDLLRAAALAVLPPVGKYRCIVVDPPWEVQKYEREVRPNQAAELDYPTMTHDQIASLDLGARAADDGCHLFCWTTQKHLPPALSIVKDWGFSYCLLMVWHKTGGPQPWGLPQYNCEFVVYARRGAPEFVDTKQFFTCFSAPRREHSRKPDEFYELLKRVTAGPRLDWFSREPREGFEQHGNETGKFAA